MKSTANQRVKELRSLTGLSQSQFAVNAGLSLPTISGIESNALEVSMRTAKALKEAYNINETFLLTGKGEMFLDGGLKINIKSDNSTTNPWKDEAYNNLKVQLEAMQKRYDALFDAVVSGKLGKLLALKYAGNLKQVA